MKLELQYIVFFRLNLAGRRGYNSYIEIFEFKKLLSSWKEVFRCLNVIKMY